MNNRYKTVLSWSTDHPPTESFSDTYSEAESVGLKALEFDERVIHMAVYNEDELVSSATSPGCVRHYL